MGLTVGGDMQVARTSKYQAQVRDALSTWQEEEDGELMALLVAEPLNPLIVHAVRVDLVRGRERTVAGYLSESHSEIFHELDKSAMGIGALPLMKARGSGGNGEHPTVELRLIHLAMTPAGYPSPTRSSPAQMKGARANSTLREPALV